MGELNFRTPVDSIISHPFGELRKNRIHKGIDFASPKGTAVYASESGKVVRASFHERTGIGTGSFGNVVVIDHTPYAAKNKRHIYTLYAHLDAIMVGAGSKINKGDVIGLSGNTGTVQYYKAKDNSGSTDKAGGFHLHFEIIYAPYELNWQRTGAMGIRGDEYREDPAEYFKNSKSADGTIDDLTEEELQGILEKFDFNLDINLNRTDAFRLQVTIDGKNAGYLSKEKDTLIAKVRVD